MHEAYLKLVGRNADQEGNWQSKAHFFGAAAEAMRRILIDHARSAKALKRGGDVDRVDMQDADLPVHLQSERMLALDEAVDKLQSVDPPKAELVKLKFFVGLTNREIAQAMQLSESTVDRHWAYARAWLHTEMSDAAS